MQSRENAIPRTQRQSRILQSGVLAFRLDSNGPPLVLLVSKRNSRHWGIPKGRILPHLSFSENAAKEAFEEAGIKGRVSPGSIAMFRTKKRTADRQHSQIVEGWVYLIEVTQRLLRGP